MILEIDFNSDEAIYVQLRNQIIMGIACAEFADGESLPSVRQLAQVLGVNMHTVNKAYAILREEGYLKRDGDKFYLPEIIRHALGFKYEKGARPKVLALTLKS